ncbi:DUF6387 family protein [uncultured Zoogloea sp.]|uniref:DUF6387 family protein n=1 Tax=uncultured Zoogloea sp. TaxID=160237 RepID=UPI002605D58F|nr:DUF6387 family protein [uncultured Zoogloea sp.]
MSKKTSEPIRVARKWFDLEKYASISEFNELQWAEQIHKRRTIQTLINTNSLSEAKNLIRQITLDPLSQEIDETETMQIENALKHRGFSIVRPLTFADIKHLTFLANELPPAAVSNLLQPLEEAFMGPDCNLGDHLCARGFLAITLTASDAEILNSVKAWLKRRRDISRGALHKIRIEEIKNKNATYAKKLKSAKDLYREFLDDKNPNPEKISNALNRLEKIIYDKIAAREPESGQALDENSTHGNSEIANINHLAASLSELIEQAITNCRERTKIYEEEEALVSRRLQDLTEEKNLKVTTKRWISSRVIPYFDLKAWSKLENVKLTDENLTELLFRPENESSSLNAAKDLYSQLFESDYFFHLMGAHFGA